MVSQKLRAKEMLTKIIQPHDDLWRVRFDYADDVYSHSASSI